MHHHVGVATDRRGEMRIIVEGQSIMADVLRGVTGFLHGSDRNGLDQVLFRTALHLVQQTIDAFRYLDLATAGLDLVTEAPDELGEILHLVWIGQLMDTIDEGLGLFPLGRTAYKLCHGPVGQEHELLDQLVRLLGHLEIDAERLALLINLKFHLIPVEIDRSLLEATLAQLLR